MIMLTTATWLWRQQRTVRQTTLAVFFVFRLPEDLMSAISQGVHPLARVSLTRRSTPMNTFGARSVGNLLSLEASRRRIVSMLAVVAGAFAVRRTSAARLQQEEG